MIWIVWGMAEAALLFCLLLGVRLARLTRRVERCEYVHPATRRRHV